MSLNAPAQIGRKPAVNGLGLGSPRTVV